jgi:hypothetical protein
LQHDARRSPVDEAHNEYIVFPEVRSVRPGKRSASAALDEKTPTVPGEAGHSAAKVGPLHAYLVAEREGYCRRASCTRHVVVSERVDGHDSQERHRCDDGAETHHLAASRARAASVSATLVAGTLST